MQEHPIGLDQNPNDGVQWSDDKNGQGVQVQTPPDSNKKQPERVSGQDRIGSDRPIDEKDMSLVEKAHKHGEDAADLIAERRDN